LRCEVTSSYFLLKSKLMFL